MINERNELILKYSQDPFFCQDAISFMCGDLIGSGIHRDVFVYNMDPRYVVKIQNDSSEFSNILEFEVWGYVKETEYAKFFAPCTWMSANGRILIQRRTKPLSEKLRPPEYIPNFFWDVKDSNFGYIGNQFVAHDYEFSVGALIRKGLSKRVKKYKPHLK